MANDLLDIGQLDDVLQSLNKHQVVATCYYPLGLSLGLSDNTLKVIESDHRGDTARCLSECLSAWLRKADNVESKGDPSWYILKYALRSTGNNAAADKIDQERHPACMILAHHQSQSLKDSLPYMDLAILLHKEGIIQEVLPVHEGRQVLLTTVQEAVCLNHKNLEKFATILKKFTATESVGRSILKDYRKQFVPDYAQFQAVSILSDHNTSLSQSLCNPVSVAKLLYGEKVLSEQALANVRSVRSLSEKKRVLLVAVREAVQINHQCLETFGTVLYRCSNSSGNVQLGQIILKNYRALITESSIAKEMEDDHEMFTPSSEALLTSPTTNVEIHIPQSLSPEFSSIRASFGRMFYNVRKIITKSPPSLEELKVFLEDCYHYLESQLTDVNTLSSLLQLIKKNCTLIDIKPLDAIVHEFVIAEAEKFIEEYKTTLNEFCQSISIELCLNERFEAVKTHPSLRCETATYVFDWEPEEHKLQDITDILSKASGRLVKIKYIEKVCSITVTCTFLYCLTGAVFTKALEGLEMLKKNGLMQLTVGYGTVWKREEEKASTCMILDDELENIKNGTSTNERNEKVEQEKQLSEDQKEEERKSILEEKEKELKDLYMYGDRNKEESELREKLLAREKQMRKMTLEIGQLQFSLQQSKAGLEEELVKSKEEIELLQKKILLLSVQLEEKTKQLLQESELREKLMARENQSAQAMALDIKQSQSSLQTEAPEKVYVYMDHSNAWIEAKKLLGSVSGKEDHRIRIDVGRLLKIVAKDRIVKEAVLYGSEPLPLDTVWKEMAERGWIVKTQKRSSWTGKQKQVDTSGFVADVTKMVCKTKPTGTVVLISGDTDIIPAIRAAMEENWKVEVYSWRHALAAKLKDLEKCKVEYLDDYRDHILFNSMKFPIAKNTRLLAIVRAKGIVCKMSRGGNPTANWCAEVEEKFGQKFQYYGMEEFDTKTKQPMEGHLLVLVFAYLRADSFKIADIIKSHKEKKFHIKHVLEMEAYYHYEQKSETTMPYLHTVNQYSLLDIMKEDNDLIGLPIISPDSSTGASCSSTITVERHEDCSQADTSKEQLVDLEQLTENDWHDVQYKRSKKKDKQLYSQPCDNGIHCQHALKCWYKHTEAEREYFKANGRGKPLPPKSTLCWHYPNCTRPDLQCKFAHGEKDAYCYKCNTKGHFAKNCK